MLALCVSEGCPQPACDALICARPFAPIIASVAQAERRLGKSERHKLRRNFQIFIVSTILPTTRNLQSTALTPRPQVAPARAIHTATKRPNAQNKRSPHSGVGSARPGLLVGRGLGRRSAALALLGDLSVERAKERGEVRTKRESALEGGSTCRHSEMLAASDFSTHLRREVEADVAHLAVVADLVLDNLRARIEGACKQVVQSKDRSSQVKGATAHAWRRSKAAPADARLVS
jgi:hypothetical protein